ncbi:hypothetical protein TBLA_0E03720 [Henningerozyma blattae CBS 6284]|uniref:Uncharacterized protein n=1 Tax=Henningerozyma blattae (strain ATCC 34711 / CBS 6284 / DSM 70876 / NBRC 10599 / NRRL Y-10934 / UCD 77-7) TaxID=1071380 RepID=I2H4X4_HENB6|nr:hypothetical protein TBLA_0E03720 [Tetrapisispora blattae CBS 6284]CCH61426.1 hypothetical protein TBLA_0E03720 [Tetrapisispora blattae CBS 6284]
MNVINFKSLSNLSIWVDPLPIILSNLMISILQENDDIEIQFIDSNNSFPINQFQKIIQNKDIDSRIYERVRISTCLDLNELKIISDRLVQINNIRKIRHEQKKINRKNESNNITKDINNEDSTKDSNDNANNSNILNKSDTPSFLFISGLDVMFRNTQLGKSAEEAHSLLKECLLKLRIVGNTIIDDQFFLRTIIGFPINELAVPESNSNHTFSGSYKSIDKIGNKRVRRSLKGNTLGEYVSKYFSDKTLSDKDF